MIMDIVFSARSSFLIEPGPGLEQRRPVHRLFREIDQFRVDLHPGGFAVRPDVSDRLGPVHVVERAHAHHLDAGQHRDVPEPAVAVRAKVHSDDIAAASKSSSLTIIPMDHAAPVKRWQSLQWQL